MNSISAMARCIAVTAPLMSAPRSNLDDASVLRPSFLLVRRTEAGLKYALSKTIDLVVPDTSETRPPMTPAIAWARSRSAITSMSSSSFRSTPSSVWVTALDQHVVGDVDDGADGSDAGGLQAGCHPRRRRDRRIHVGHGARIPRPEFLVFDGHAKAIVVARRHSGAVGHVRRRERNLERRS